MHVVPPPDPTTAEDEEIGEPIADEAQPSSIQAHELVKQARQYDMLAGYQQQQARVTRPKDAWLADRYDTAAKANHRLAVVLAERGARMKGSPRRALLYRDPL